MLSAIFSRFVAIFLLPSFTAFVPLANLSEAFDASPNPSPIFSITVKIVLLYCSVTDSEIVWLTAVAPCVPSKSPVIILPGFVV